MKLLPLGLLLLGGLAVLALALTAATGGSLPGCPFRALAGLYCPGCGTTRAVLALAQGQIATAFSFNPLFVLLLPVLGYALLVSVARRSAWGRSAWGRSDWGRSGWLRAGLPAFVSRALFFLLLAYFVARNVWSVLQPGGLFS